MVFWCGGGLFSAPGKGWQNWQKTIFNIGKRLLFLIFNRVSKGTLDSFLVRFRGVSVLHCHGVLVWRRVVYVVFSTGGSTTGKGWQNWQKAISTRVSEGTLNIFLVWFRGVSVLHCHGVLVWRRAVFSSGFSTTGKGWQNWQKAIFNRVAEGTLETFLVRFRGVSVVHCHGVLVWRRAVFSTGGNTTGKGWQNWQKTIFNIGKRLFLFYWQKTIFHSQAWFEPCCFDGLERYIDRFRNAQHDRTLLQNKMTNTLQIISAPQHSYGLISWKPHWMNACSIGAWNEWTSYWPQMQCLNPNGKEARRTTKAQV